MIYADIESLVKKQIFVKITQKNIRRQKQEIKFLAIIQCQQFEHMIIKKIKKSLYFGEDCMKKIYESLREHAKNILDFEMKKTLSLTKKRTKIASKCNRMLYLLKNNYKKVEHLHFGQKLGLK